ncbi:MAG: DMT family transporter [Gemmatimonadaceae bacterium]|nr:DMT family transporter [Gemmatimonadaceae bacterium]
MLGFSVLGISLAAPLIRLSGASALVIAAWRLGFSLILVAIALLVSGDWRAWRVLSRRDGAMACGAGVLLALHFWSWNASIGYTTVAASVSLVNTQPVIIALISARWLGERATRAQWIGIIIAVFGALVVGLADFSEGTGGALASRALIGDLLACVGAVTAALYYLIGRRIRKTLALWPYVGLVYGAAFAVCVALAVLTGEHIAPQPGREIAIFAGLAIGPMLLGHTGMNWALGHLPAYVVNLTTLGEPIGATLLAALLPGIAEIPGPGTLVGGALVLGGILLTAPRT